MMVGSIQLKSLEVTVLTYQDSIEVSRSESTYVITPKDG